MDSAGPFREDEEGNRFLLAAIDPFSKWVEVLPVQTLHSWRTAEFLYDICCRWGKPKGVRTDNGSEYSGSFSQLCSGLGIKHVRITVGNSKANGQIERVFRVIKEVVSKGMAADRLTYWSNHLPAALALLRFTEHRAH